MERSTGSQAKVVEFASRLEELMPAVELTFDPAPGFGRYRALMPRDSVRHPAKFNVNLIEFLIKKYTEEGDTVLDPMAGTGILGVVAALHGRNAIQVEIEPEFYRWMEEARVNVERLRTLSLKGRILNICGDARRLTQLLGNVDLILTSPPYAETNLSGGDPERRRERLVRAGRDPRDFLGGVARNAVLKHYAGSSPNNIGGLKYGDVDAIITSPPYDGALEGTSRHTKGGIASRDKALAQTGTYALIATMTTREGSPNPNNIGNLKSSEGEYHALERALGGRALSDEELEILYRRLTRGGKPTYLSEMLRVYREMYKVLKPGGRAIVVVKPFIRNKRVVDLPYHTYLLMSKCGFTLEELYKLRLKQRSFWRILYMKRYPTVPVIAHEYVLVCGKTA